MSDRVLTRATVPITVVVGLVLLIVTFYPPSTAEGKGKKKVRRVTVEYQGPGLGISTYHLGFAYLTLPCYNDAPHTCVRIPTNADERSVRIRIEDLSGTAVMAAVDQTQDDFEIFCGKSDHIPIVGGQDVRIHLLEGLCEDREEPSVVSIGTISATFSP
ncbi:MAG: hypothetical protein ACRDI3_03710 [Actinomycetota bacterium]